MKMIETPDTAAQQTTNQEGQHVSNVTQAKLTVLSAGCPAEGVCAGVM